MSDNTRSPRWLNWALQRSTNPPHFKRKAIRNGLINDKGISLPEGEWSWSQIDTVRFTERRSSSGSPGRTGYHTTSHKSLSFETIDGKRGEL